MRTLYAALFSSVLCAAVFLGLGNLLSAFAGDHHASINAANQAQQAPASAEITQQQIDSAASPVERAHLAVLMSDGAVKGLLLAMAESEAASVGSAGNMSSPGAPPSDPSQEGAAAPQAAPAEAGSAGTASGN